MSFGKESYEFKCERNEMCVSLSSDGSISGLESNCKDYKISFFRYCTRSRMEVRPCVVQPVFNGTQRLEDFLKEVSGKRVA